MEVGRLAQKMFPKGILLDRDPLPQGHCDQSVEALKYNKPLFEAGFVSGKAYAIADILAPSAGDAWDLFEVKSSTKLKDEHLYDLAFQKLVLEGSGIRLRRCFLVHIVMPLLKQAIFKLEPALC